MDFDVVADELYGLPPDEFTAIRDQRAAEARAGGDREMAAAVKGLRRPAVSAWLVNLLARERVDRLEELLALSDAFREAQENRAARDLRRLSTQRRRLVAGLGRDARRLASDIDRHVSADAARELEGTLEAAVALPAAAESVRRGRLTKPLRYAGLGGSAVLDEDSEPTGPEADQEAAADLEEAPGPTATVLTEDSRPADLSVLRDEGVTGGIARRSARRAAGSAAGQAGRRASRRSRSARGGPPADATEPATVTEVIVDPGVDSGDEPLGGERVPHSPAPADVGTDGAAEDEVRPSGDVVEPGESGEPDEAAPEASDDLVIRRARRRGFRSTEGMNPTPSAAERHRHERYESARKAYDDAAEADREAAARADADDEAAAQAADRLERARADLAKREEQLRRAQDEQGAAVRHARTAQKARASSARRAEEAHRSLERARQVVERLRP
ncbi:MAG: hypothetical protein ACQSGP_08785 [Frankia sp.]